MYGLFFLHFAALVTLSKATAQWIAGKDRDAESKGYDRIGAAKLALQWLLKSSYKLSMKKIRYVLSSDYESEIEKMLSMLDVDSIREELESKGKSPVK